MQMAAVTGYTAVIYNRMQRCHINITKYHESVVWNRVVTEDTQVTRKSDQTDISRYGLQRLLNVAKANTKDETWTA